MKIKKIYIVIAVIAVIAVLSILLSWQLFFSAEKVERVVIVTIDTLRADHVSSDGYIIETTPFLDDFGKQGIVFKNAIAATSSTSPSHASIFTSLHPLEHGVLKNGHRLAGHFVTMAEVFSQMGYKTAGVVSTDRHFFAGDFHQGFDYFNEPRDLEIFQFTRKSLAALGKDGVGPETLRRLETLEGISFPGGDAMLKRVEELLGDDYSAALKTTLLAHTAVDLKYRNGNGTIDVALDWLNTLEPTDKFFLWIHLFDPHGPLRPDPEHLRHVEALCGDDTLNTFLLEQHHIDLNSFHNDKTRMNRLITKYDAEIHYTDAQLCRFFETYAARGFDTRSLSVITADHGQGLGNHNWVRHGINIYNEQLRVPLMFRFSSGKGKGTVIEHIVEHVDIFPTVFDFIRGESPEVKGIRGESLASLMFGDEAGTNPGTYAYSQRREYEPGEGRDDEEMYALQTLSHKYIYFSHGPDGFFDLRRDPYELRNLVDDDSAAAERERLKGLLLQMVNRMKKNNPARRLKVDQKTIERLKSMGYVQ